jgi:hypothetical protein
MAGKPRLNLEGARPARSDVTQRRGHLQRVVEWLSDISRFSRDVLEHPLRSYQLEPARAILRSILEGRGDSFVVMMSRQAGKNELSAQLEAYLLNLYRYKGGQIVKASPTFKPQTINSIMRLADRLDNVWNRGGWRRREGYIVELDRARCLFFSADPSANVVGATADLLLEGDEAQEIRVDKWTKDFLPMGASTNVTRVLWGTAWTSDTLLARWAHDLRRQERRDGRRRVFAYDAGRVGAEVPAYAAYVQGEVARLGRDHPLIRTQYFLEEVDAQGGLFNAARRALMQGGHVRQHAPTDPPAEAARYALLIDVGGEDEAAGTPQERARLQNPRRDATALTVVAVTLPQAGGIGQVRLPSYRAVDRKLWLGVRHTALHQQILALARHWGALWVVVDATGVGAGLASFLAGALGERVVPVHFSPRLKSDLGWRFLGLVETGRYRDYARGVGADAGATDTRQFWYEVAACQFQVGDGPGRLMRWGVWEAPAYDGTIAYGHDDLLISAALCALLDDRAWPGTGASAVVHREDALEEIDAAEW